MKARYALMPLAWMLQGASAAAAEPACAHSIAQLRELLADPGFPLRWQETTMDDGRPLLMVLRDQDGALALSIGKRDGARWADGRASFCLEASKLEARFIPGTASIGSGAPWVVRYALRHEARLVLTRLGPAALRVSTLGWSGGFVAQP